MKRLALGVAALALAAAFAPPASAHAYVKWCMPTAPHPCGICAEEAGVSKCVDF